MPVAAAIPLITSLGGAGLTALAGRSKPTTSTTQQQSTSGSSTEDLNRLIEQLEDPAFSSFRSSLLPLVSQALQKSNEPVYGTGEKASYLSQLNDLTNDSIKSLRGSLAATGGLDSGRLSSGITSLLSGRQKSAADFFGGLPFKEAQAKSERQLPLLQLATSWAGKAPISERTSGTSRTSSSQTSTGTGQSVGSSPGFWGSFGTGLGASAGRGLWDSPLSKIFGGGSGTVAKGWENWDPSNY